MIKKNLFNALLLPCYFYVVSGSISAHDPNNLSPDDQANITLEVPLLETNQFELLGTDKGALEITIKASNMYQYENGNLRLTDVIEIFIVGDKINQDKGPIRIQANKLFYNKQKGLCMIAEKVLLTQPEQQLSIETEELWYDMNKEIIFTTLPIVVTHKEHVLKGTGFRATKDLTNYTVTAPSGELDVNQEAV